LLFGKVRTPLSIAAAGGSAVVQTGICLNLITVVATFKAGLAGVLVRAAKPITATRRYTAV
jgi:hypothetical protein